MGGYEEQGVNNEDDARQFAVECFSYMIPKQQALIDGCTVSTPTHMITVTLFQAYSLGSDVQEERSITERITLSPVLKMCAT